MSTTESGVERIKRMVAEATAKKEAEKAALAAKEAAEKTLEQQEKEQREALKTEIDGQLTGLAANLETMTGNIAESESLLATLEDPDEDVVTLISAEIATMRAEAAEVAASMAALRQRKEALDQGVPAVEVSLDRAAEPVATVDQLAEVTIEAPEIADKSPFPSFEAFEATILNDGETPEETEAHIKNTLELLKQTAAAVDTLTDLSQRAALLKLGKLRQKFGGVKSLLVRLEAALPDKKRTELQPVIRQAFSIEDSLNWEITKKIRKNKTEAFEGADGSEKEKEFLAAEKLENEKEISDAEKIFQEINADPATFINTVNAELQEASQAFVRAANSDDITVRKTRNIQRRISDTARNSADKKIQGLIKFAETKRVSIPNNLLDDLDLGRVGQIPLRSFLEVMRKIKEQVG